MPVKYTHYTYLTRFGTIRISYINTRKTSNYTYTLPLNRRIKFCMYIIKSYLLDNAIMYTHQMQLLLMHSIYVTLSDFKDIFNG
jgi:hypothetical protein